MRCKSIFNIVVASAVFCAGCVKILVDNNNGGEAVGPNNQNAPDNQNDSGAASVWLWSNQKTYTVANDTAGDVSEEISNTWISYTDDKHWEQRYSCTIPYNEYAEHGTYTSSMVNSTRISTSGSKNGNTERIVSRTITESEMTMDYADPAAEDVIRRMASDVTTTSTNIYDEESGLMLSSVSTSTGTRNGEPFNGGTSEIRYTIVPTGADGNVKTYRHYRAAAAGGAYTEYRIQNDIILEQKSYTAAGALSSATTHTFPDNKIIRAKLPTFTLQNHTFGAAQTNSGYQTCDVISNSAEELTIRVKTFSAAGKLIEQTETTYNKR